MFSFSGMMAPTFAPLHADGSLNINIIPDYVEYLIRTGVKGVYINGTSGEGMSLTVPERKLIAKCWVTACKDFPLTVVIMVGAGCLKDTQELASHAERLGADAIATLPCLYDKPATVEELVDYCSEVAKMAPKTPLLYYHIPFKTNVNFQMDQFLEIGGKTIPTLSGLKFTSLEVEEGFRCVKLLDGKYTIFSGFDGKLFQSLDLGYNCAINCCFNFLAKDAARIFELVEEGRKYPEEGDAWKEKALKQQKMIDDALQKIFSFTGGLSVAAMKAAMKILTGLDLGPPRKPIVPLSEASLKAMEETLKKII